jgi:hypothetical protein
MFAAANAVLLVLDPLRVFLPVLRRVVVARLALRAGERDLYSILGHFPTSEQLSVIGDQWIPVQLLMTDH